MEQVLFSYICPLDIHRKRLKPVRSPLALGNIQASRHESGKERAVGFSLLSSVYEGHFSVPCKQGRNERRWYLTES
jgi:hypothetical protein